MGFDDDLQRAFGGQYDPSQRVDFRITLDSGIEVSGNVTKAVLMELLRYREPLDINREVGGAVLGRDVVVVLPPSQVREFAFGEPAR